MEHLLLHRPPLMRLGMGGVRAEVGAAVLPSVDSGSVRQQLDRLVKESLSITVPTVTDVEPQVAICSNAAHGDYQWYCSLTSGRLLSMVDQQFCCI